MSSLKKRAKLVDFSCSPLRWIWRGGQAQGEFAGSIFGEDDDGSSFVKDFVKDFCVIIIIESEMGSLLLRKPVTRQS